MRASSGTLAGCNQATAAVEAEREAFQGPREQFGDGLHRVIGQPCDDIDQVGLGIDPLLPAVFDEGEEVGQTGAGAWVADPLTTITPPD